MSVRNTAPAWLTWGALLRAHASPEHRADPLEISNGYCSRFLSLVRCPTGPSFVARNFHHLPTDDRRTGTRGMRTSERTSNRTSAVLSPSCILSMGSASWPKSARNSRQLAASSTMRLRGFSNARIRRCLDCGGWRTGWRLSLAPIAATASPGLRGRSGPTAQPGGTKIEPDSLA
jgi:hypothetical protein